MISVREELAWLKHPFTVTSDHLHRQMLQKAYEHANAISPDPSTKNGSVLVSLHHGILSYGVNKFPNGVAETQSRLTDKTTKYRMVVHAENGAIFNAAKNGNATREATLYCPFYACSECAKAIIQAGVIKIVGHAQLMALAGSHTTWVDTIVNAWEMLEEAGVECCLYDGEIGVVTRFNGEDIAV